MAPLNCTRMPHLISITNDDGCVSHTKINIAKCDGGCGKFSTLCCDKAVTRKEDVALICPDNSVKHQLVSQVPQLVVCSWNFTLFLHSWTENIFIHTSHLFKCVARLIIENICSFEIFLFWIVCDSFNKEIHYTDICRNVASIVHVLVNQ